MSEVAKKDHDHHVTTKELQLSITCANDEQSYENESETSSEHGEYLCEGHWNKSLKPRLHRLGEVVPKVREWISCCKIGFCISIGDTVLEYTSPGIHFRLYIYTETH